MNWLIITLFLAGMFSLARSLRPKQRPPIRRRRRVWTPEQRRSRRA
jgi:hypothetical protein